MSQTIPKPSILAVFITYNPNLELLSDAIRAVMLQGCECLIVDNGSSSEVSPETLPKGIELKLLEENFGLGAAQNIGITTAVKQKRDYILLLDQDSLPSSTMVANLVKAHKAKSQVQKVGAVGPLYRNVRTQTESFFVRFGALKFKRLSSADQDSDACVETDFLISSGSLFAPNVFATVGLMDEELFIDHVDTEWFLRARAMNHISYGVCDAVMQHDLGEATHKMKLAGRERNVPQHKPFRYYYIFRNSILLYKRNNLSKLWKWNDAQRLVMIGIMFGLVTAPRIANLSMMVKGIWHGLLGRTGKLAQDVSSR